MTKIPSDTYVLVDPYILFMPPSDSLTTLQASKYIETIQKWSKAITEYAVKLRITSRCKTALIESSGYPLDFDKLSAIIHQHRLGVDPNDVYSACSPLFENLLDDENFIDFEIEKSQTGEFYWEINTESILIKPEVFVTRIPNSRISLAFRKMLADICFARENKIEPVGTLKTAVLATEPIPPDKQSDSKKEDKASSNFAITVIANYEYAINDLIQGNVLQQPFNDDTVIEIDIPGVGDPICFEPISLSFPSVLAAAEAAVSKYPGVFILHENARYLAQRAKHKKPEEIYKLIIGIYTVLLPARLKKGDGHAIDEYRKAFVKEYTPNESDTVANTLKFRTQREVIYKNKRLYCTKHIKALNGPPNSSFRIYFEILEDPDNGSHQILLTRIGEHPDNTRS